MNRIITITLTLVTLLSGMAFVYSYFQYNQVINYFGEDFQTSIAWLREDNVHVKDIQLVSIYEGRVSDLSLFESKGIIQIAEPSGQKKSLQFNRALPSARIFVSDEETSKFIEFNELKDYIELDKFVVFEIIVDDKMKILQKGTISEGPTFIN